MKKLLRPLIILLLLALGFLYIVKNPELPISQGILTTLGIDMTTDEGTGVDLTNCLKYFDGCNTCMVSGGVIGGCTKMYCQTPAEPQCLEYIWTGMDLSGCISYFDGCNNCTVENGRPSACTLMYCETPSEPKCNEYATESEMTGAEEINSDETIYNNSEYGLSFTYPKAREINIQTSDDPGSEDCSLKLNISVSDPSKPLQCFEAGCEPNIKPSIAVNIRKTTSCSWFSSTCNGLDSSTQNTCQQLKNLGISEEKAARTASLGGLNGFDYTIVKGNYGYILKGFFIDGIVNQARAFLLEKNGYGVQIFDNEGMYSDVFDDFIKSFKYN